MIVNYTKTIVYYDTPQLFIVQDRAKTKFICLLAERCSDHDVYLCVRISEHRLASFLKGMVDLLSIYQEPEMDEFYCAKTDNLREIHIELIERDDIPQAWFPESGFYNEKGRV